MKKLIGIINVEINDKLIYSKSTHNSCLSEEDVAFGIKSDGAKNTILKDKKQGSE